MRPIAVIDAVLSISSTKAAAVHGTASTPRSSNATIESWTAARAIAQSGNSRRPVPYQRPSATVAAASTSTRAPNHASFHTSCTGGACHAAFRLGAGTVPETPAHGNDHR